MFGFFENKDVAVETILERWEKAIASFESRAANCGHGDSFEISGDEAKRIVDYLTFLREQLREVSVQLEGFTARLEALENRMV